MNKDDQRRKLANQLAEYFKEENSQLSACCCSGFWACSRLDCPAWWDGFLDNISPQELVEMTKLWEKKRFFS